MNFFEKDKQNSFFLTNLEIESAYKNFSELTSTYNGETAIGNGSRLPLVMSTLTKLFAFLKTNKLIKINKIIFFIINLLTYLLDQN